MNDDLITALLSTQRALWGEITPNLRAVKVDVDAKNGFLIDFYYDGAIDESIEDSAVCIAMEASCAFPPDVPGADREIRLDYPKEIPLDKHFVYLRNEDALPRVLIHEEKDRFTRQIANRHPRGIALLAALHALLGKVTPELRVATVDWDQSEAIFYFRLYYDHEISGKNIALAKEALDDFGNFLPEEKISDVAFYRLDYPNPVPYKNLVYQRKEPAHALTYIGPAIT